MKFECAIHLDVSAGTVVFIANYTGDCLNFGLAVEWAKSEGLKVIFLKNLCFPCVKKLLIIDNVEKGTDNTKIGKERGNS